MPENQQAGFLDRVFNSTFSLPQQAIWRVWRALEDEDIDLFSEKGLLDFALVPGLGVLDDHKEDVMPDYMAAQVGKLAGGSGKEQDTGIVGQLSAAILTDPLTYLTGGLSAAGKLGKAVSTVAGARKAPTLTKVMQKAATKADVSMAQFGRETTIEQLGLYIDEAVDTLSGVPMTKQVQAEMKTLGRARTAITKSAKKAAVDMGTNPTIHDTLQMTADRQIALGLPGLATFGAKIEVSKGYSSWWKRFGDGVSQGGDALAQSALTNTLVDSVPGLRGAGRAVTAPMRHAAAGWKAGGRAKVAISDAAAQMSDEDFLAYKRWTNTDTGAGAIVPQLTEAGANVVPKITKQFVVNTKLGMESEEAFRQAMLVNGIGASSESGTQIWGRIAGMDKDSATFPRWGDASKATKDIEEKLDAAVDGFSLATSRLNSGVDNVHVVDTDAGRLANVFEAERGEMGKLLGSLSESSFKTGLAFKEAINVAFKTGEKTSFGQRAYNDYLAHTARDNDQLEFMAEGLYKRIGKIIELPGHDLKRRDIEKLFGSMMQLQGLPAEIEAGLGLAKLNPENATAALNGLLNLTNRHRGIMNTFEKMLDSGGISDKRIRTQISGLFNDEVFPFLERRDATKLRGAYAKKEPIVHHYKDAPTLQDKRRLRRINNRHTILGADIVEASGDASSRFDPEMLTKHDKPSFKSRDRVTLMPIKDFLRLAPGGTDPIKTKNVAEIMASGDDLKELPYLRFSYAEDGSTAGVYGHEGRHRARALLAAGETHMPVRLEGPMRWGEQADPKGFDYVKEWPTELRGQDGRHTLPFPVSREMATQSFTEQRAARQLAPKRVLSKYQGRQAGFLDNTELDKAIDEVESYGLRRHTDDEIREWAETNTPFKNFRERHKLTTDTALAVLKRKSKGGTTHQIAKREEAIKPQLWDDKRTNWTVAQSETHLAKYGLRIEKAEDGTLAIRSSEVTEATLRRGHGWDKGKMTGHRTLRSAMAEARGWLGRQGKYVTKYGPKESTAVRNVPIHNLDMEAVRGSIGQTDLDFIQGKGRTFDLQVLPENMRTDRQRLVELKKRRNLPEDHALHEAGPIEARKRRVSSDVPAPRSEGKVTHSLLDYEGNTLKTEEEFSAWALSYASGKQLIKEVQRALGRARRYGTKMELDPTVLADLDRHAKQSGELINDMVLRNLPPELQKLWDDVRQVQAYQFDGARKAGVWLPGSPIAYLGRYFNKNGKARITKIIGDMEQTDGALLVRLGVKQSQRFGRTMDAYSIDDLNTIHAEVRKLAMEEGADARWAQYSEGIETAMKESGVSVGAGKEAYSSDRLVTDPFLSLLQRLGASNQDATIESYFENLLSAAGTKPGESQMLGGKVVGVIDNSGSTKTLTDVPKYGVRRGYGAEAGENLDLVEELGDHKLLPQSFIIETAEGKRHIIPNAMLQESGFGLLELGDVGEAAALGYTPTVGKSFAKASLRSDLHESIHQAQLGVSAAHGMLGQHVVFGSHNLLVSSLKSAAKVHEVTAPALRTFDSVNYMIKSFQTIFRLPFHVANLSSGVYQTMLAGASPKHVVAAYMDTLRFMAGDQAGLGKASGMLGDMLGTDEAVGGGVRRLLGGDRSMILAQTRLQGSGDLARHMDALEDAGSDIIEDLIIKHADGTETDIAELITLAGEMELYGTFSSSLTRGSRTPGENLYRIKQEMLGEDLGGRITTASKKTLGRMRNVAETSEVFNRTATVIALVREGHPMRRAIEIAKEAHVPYEKLTKFERNGLKRLSVYYTFPRHYMPWAWSKFAENPKALSGLAHTIRDQNLLTAQEGRPTLVVGEHRVDIGRLNANFEAAGMLAAFYDRLALPMAEMMPGVDTVDPRQLTRTQSDAGLTSVGGVAGLMGWQNILPQGRRTENGSPDFWSDATKIIWPIKMAAQLAGKLPSKEESSPFVSYTPMESWLTDSNFGLGLRKVRPEHELRQAQVAYAREVKSLQLKAAATQDPARRERILGHIQALSGSLQQIAASSAQKSK